MICVMIVMEIFMISPHSVKFRHHKSSSFDRTQGVQSNGSGSQVGNIFYEHGVIVLTDTGSLVLWNKKKWNVHRLQVIH